MTMSRHGGATRAAMALACVVVILTAVNILRPTLVSEGGASSQVHSPVVASEGGASSQVPTPAVASEESPMLMLNTMFPEPQHLPVMPEFIFTMIHTSEPCYHTRFQAVKETWLAEGAWPWKVLAFTTGPVHEGDRVPMVHVTDAVRPGFPAEHFSHKNERVMQSYIHALIHEPTYQWYFKVEDDTYVHLEEFRNVNFSNFPDPLDKPYYVGECLCDSPQPGDWRNGGCNAPRRYDCSEILRTPLFKYACSGAGYLLSRKALEMLVHSEWVQGWPRFVDDIMVGNAMRALNVSCIHEDRFTHWFGISEDLARDMEREDRGWIKGKCCMHSVEADNMRQLHSLLSPKLSAFHGHNTSMSHVPS